jgi:cysteine desulfurase / selenocysteine lyase
MRLGVGHINFNEYSELVLRMPRRIYLDNAATSWPKDEQALQAAWDFMVECGASAGRGAYSSSQKADRWLADARLNVSRLIGAEEARSVAFCSSGTHALNAALAGVLQSGDHVITTQIEHNSLLRPLRRSQQLAQIQLDFARSDHRGMADIDHARSLVKPNTRWLVVGHASNVTGAVQPLQPWRNLADQCGAKLLVDASQSLGYLPINVVQQGIDLLAAAGHKGLRALPGTGLLYVSSELQTKFQPLMTGGTGLTSESLEPSAAWPQTVEVGNYNLPGIVSMAVAAAGLNAQTPEAIDSWQNIWRLPFRTLVQGLSRIQGVHLIGYDLPLDPNHDQPERVPLVSIGVDNWSVHELATVLDSVFGIEVRAGYHCSALVHQAIGSQPEGTLRLSPGHTTTTAEIEQTLNSLQEIVEQKD